MLRGAANLATQCLIDPAQDDDRHEDEEYPHGVRHQVVGVWGNLLVVPAQGCG